MAGPRLHSRSDWRVAGRRLSVRPSFHLGGGGFAGVYARRPDADSAHGTASASDDAGSAVDLAGGTAERMAIGHRALEGATKVGEGAGAPGVLLVGGRLHVDGVACSGG